MGPALISSAGFAANCLRDLAGTVVWFLPGDADFAERVTEPLTSLVERSGTNQQQSSHQTGPFGERTIV